MTTPSDDELAETAMPGSSVDPLERTATTAPGDAPRPTGETIGRLRLERVLGRGGMGTVHAAYDPDLERRVAVKLLHATDTDARARLLREARAMAKLSHANVITVFDVGSADGQDFVTMELVDGGTLKDWLATDRPSWRETVTAFIHAGRGLAAAHEAGLVHRDFKPANVLRSKTGEVVVTDFGLSRAATDAVVPPEVSERVPADTGPSTRTATGAFLGTPAYMAPEQWTGETVGPASDQFAFAVALAEALAGKRPYTGDSLDELRTNVMRGPIVDDAIPNAIKPIIRRALATKPDERWPSMTAMLDALEAALGRRKRRIRLAAALAIGAAGTIGIVAMRSHDTTIVDCSPPALDPALVWSPARAAAVGQRDPESAKRIAADVDAWRGERDRACVAPPATRSSKLACLDGVLARIDVAARAFEHPGVATIEGTSTMLVDPAVCEHDPPPHLTTSIDAQLAAALDNLRAVREGQPDGAPAAATDACARSLQLRAQIGAIGRKQLEIPDVGRLFETIKATTKVVEHCTDDAIRAEVLLGALQHSSPDLVRTEAAVAAVPAEDYLGEADYLRGDLVAASSFDVAMASYEHALDRLSRRHHPRLQLRVVVAMQDLLLARGRTADIQRVVELAGHWRAGALPADQEYLDQRMAAAQWRLGDVAAADELAWRVGPPRNQMNARASPLPPTDVAGVVVDDAGHPVAGADVVVSDNVDADSAAGASPTTLHDVNRARTDAHGAFSIRAARGFAVAWTSDQRSVFVLATNTSLRLVVHPTVTLAGKVALGSLDGAQLRVTLSSTDPKLPFDEIAPVRADGAFELRHALPGAMTIVAREYGVDIGDPPLPVVVTATATNLALTAQKARPLDIVTRNTGVSALDVAVVFVFTGHAPGPLTTLHAIGRNFDAIVQAIAGQAIPDDVRTKMQPDDLYVKLRGRPSGPLFVCTAGMTRDMFTMLRSEQAFMKAFSTAELGCADVTADQSLVVVEVPPIRKPTP